MKNKLYYLKTLFLCAIIIIVLFSGCLKEEQKSEKYEKYCEK